MKLASAESFSFDNLKSKIQNPKSRAPVYIPTVIAILAVLTCLLPLIADAQTKPLREIKVGYPLGGSSSYFWVAYRSGSFEKHGLKLEPIYIRGGLMGIQAALSGDLPLQLQGGFHGSQRVGARRQGVSIYRRSRQSSGLCSGGSSFDQAPGRSQGEENRG